MYSIFFVVGAVAIVSSFTFSSTSISFSSSISFVLACV
jgi:hypothetical protein